MPEEQKPQEPNPTALWSISLFCDCPKCQKRVDLLDYPEFCWEDLEPAQEKKGMEVTCPMCGHVFEVDTQY